MAVTDVAVDRTPEELHNITLDVRTGVVRAQLDILMTLNKTFDKKCENLSEVTHQCFENGFIEPDMHEFNVYINWLANQAKHVFGPRALSSPRSPSGDAGIWPMPAEELENARLAGDGPPRARLPARVGILSST